MKWKKGKWRELSKGGKTMEDSRGKGCDGVVIDLKKERNNEMGLFKTCGKRELEREKEENQIRKTFK